MDWKYLPELPQTDCWVLLETNLKSTPKYEVAEFKLFDSGHEWYLPSCDEVANDKEIIKYCIIKPWTTPSKDIP